MDGGGELGALLRGHDWEAAGLGAPARWPQSLKTAIRIMLASRQPIWIGWGPDLTYFYNEPYKSIIGGKHPWALGRPTREVWAEIWSDIGPLLDTALAGHEGTYSEEQLLIMERHGYQEETYYTFSYTSIPDDEGGVGGIICANTDYTQRVLAERQLALLKALAESALSSTSAAEACALSAAALSTNRRDLPFAMVYMIDEARNEARLAGCSGIAPDHRVAREVVSLSGDQPFPIGAVLKTRRTSVIDLMGADWPKGPLAALAVTRRYHSDLAGRRRRARKRAGRRPQPLPPARRQLHKLPRPRRRATRVQYRPGECVRRRKASRVGIGGNRPRENGVLLQRQP